MIMSYTIEQMREMDLREVVQIEESSGLNRWGYDAYKRELFKNPNAILLVARASEFTSNDQNVLGFFAGWTVVDELHVNNLGTRPGHRRMGVGASLLESALEEGKLRGVAFVLLEVRASNEPAQSLYRKMGFHYIGRRRDYYRGPTEDALMMKLDLSRLR
jgi:ribosomal-protein-alanine N-acetyltransferase